MVRGLCLEDEVEVVASLHFLWEGSVVLLSAQIGGEFAVMVGVSETR